MKKIWIIALIIGLGSLTMSCQKDYLVQEVIEVPDTISFAEHVVPIFEASCNDNVCHGTGGVPPDLTPENAHFDLTVTGLVDVDDPASSVLYQRITATVKPMPPTEPLVESETQIILNWIEQGALDN